MPRGYLQQDFGSARRPPPPLLPILERVGSDAKQRRKSALRQSKAGTNASHFVLLISHDRTGGLYLGPLSFDGALHAFQPSIEQFFSHALRLSGLAEVIDAGDFWQTWCPG
jgi:hypothetical protein